MVEWISVAGGGVLVVIGLNDVFQKLFHPAGQGRLSTLLVNWSFSAGCCCKRLDGRSSTRAQESAVASAVAAGAALEEAVADFADLVGTRFLPDSGEGADAVLAAAVVDHGCRSSP